MKEELRVHPVVEIIAEWEGPGDDKIETEFPHIEYQFVYNHGVHPAVEIIQGQGEQESDKI
jgi:hypothetical protein